MNPLELVLDKELTLQILELNNIPAIRVIEINSIALRFPIVGRFHGHHGGTDLQVIQNLDQAKEGGFDYFTHLYSIEREYRVEVNELEITKVEEGIPNELALQEIPVRTEQFGWKWRHSSLPSEWEELVVRALYVTGRSTGSVKIGKTMKGSPLIIDINISGTTPVQQVFQGIGEDFKIGLDVEFMLCHEGNLVPASDFFQVDGDVGCDSRQLEGDSNEYPLAELRVAPSENPLEVFENLKECLAQASNRVPYLNIQFRSGSMPFSGYQCGGHIHFSIPLSVPLLRALDHYLAIPIFLIDDTRTFKRRARTKHGGLGRYRLKPYGFEFLALGSWIVEPAITNAVLYLAKVVGSHYPELSSHQLFDPYFQRAYYRGNKYYLRYLWGQLLTPLMRTAGFQRYQGEIQPLLDYIDQEIQWAVHDDIRKNWGIPVAATQYRQGSVLKITKELRKKHQLNEGDEVMLQAGKLIVPASVRAHPFAFRKQDPILLSEELRRQLRLPMDFTPHLMKQSNTLSLGPVIGILAKRPFGRHEEAYFHLLIRRGREKNYLVYIFEPDDIDWKQQLIRGTYFIGGESKTEYLPFPHVVYDRYFSSSDEAHRINQVYEELMSNSIKFVNPPALFNLTVDNWKYHQFLSEHLLEYLPESKFVDDIAVVKEMIDKFGDIIVKSVTGVTDKDFIRLIQTPKGIRWIDEYKREEKIVSLPELQNDIHGLMIKKDHIIQETIQQKQYEGSHFKIRVTFQKNSKQVWFYTGMVAMLSKGIITGSSEVIRSSIVLNNLYLDEEKRYQIKQTIIMIGKQIALCLEDKVGKIGEFAFDIMIDRFDQIKIIDINSKADNLFSLTRAYRLRNMAAYRLLNYATVLAGFDPQINSSQK
ncbi:hypothetical protein D0469_15455 [Peribacillus saganii]|uniref:ATP-grasp domain-containing protein n=1 Tax=Peribacillus saganii TaxID=2303992 RepID=A0A372LKL3_9BACI|nr:YheC/YheD family protein [Peribacillus saganii]RFU67289.1 hypothetical protein D0469_15455 [Peribacillus saganii]